MSSLFLVRNAELHDPSPMGRKDVLVGGGKVLRIGNDLEVPAGVDVIDAGGAVLAPGFIDSLVHISGGGGEGGFATRTAALLDAQEPLRAGITTLVGALGTDDITRSLPDLLACARSLTEQGLSAFVLTGSYQVPVTTFTGSVRSDLVLIPDVIGVGEVAVADHRGSHPGIDELARLGSQARVGGMLAGKRGTVLVHVGDAEEGLSILHEVSDRHPLPPSQWHPTHINRNAGLLAQTPAWVARGGSVDITTSTTPALLADGDIAAAAALRQLIEQNVPVTRISMSSDGQASLPHFDATGELLGIEVAPIVSLHEALASAVRDHGLALSDVLTTVTRTPAAIWGLKGKGEIRVGADADMVLLDPDSLAVLMTIAGGRPHRTPDT